MKENQEDELLNRDFEGSVFDSEISELNLLTNTILDYYSFSQLEEGEEWKKGTSHENKIVPDDINELVGLAFKTQLKKFIKK